MLSRLSYSIAWLSLCVAGPALAVLHKALPGGTPAGWSAIGAPAKNETIVLQVALELQNLDKLESMIYAVSIPGSSSYGKFMEGDAVSALVAPKKNAGPAVERWLKSAGVSQIHSDGEYVTFATSIGRANTLLNTQFKYYEKDGITKLRTTAYSIPDDVAAHIDLISPTTYFGKTTTPPKMIGASRKRFVTNPRPTNTTNSKIDESCDFFVTPQCLKKTYNIGDYAADPKAGSKIGFGVFHNDSARVADLTLFQRTYNLPDQGFDVQIIDDGPNDQSESEHHYEPNLDVQTIMGIVEPLPITSYNTGGLAPFLPNLFEPSAADNTNEPFLPYYQYLLAQKNSDLPQVISTSYGEDEQTVPEDYARRVCNMIGQLGVRGISVLVGSGDTGVGGPCQSNDGKAIPEFTPQFPPTCPYVTAVGGTKSLEPEVAWEVSSGGFSKYFKQPEYQKAAVADYLANHIDPATLQYYQPFFNQAKRGFPDVSAHSASPKYVIFPIASLLSHEQFANVPTASPSSSTIA